MPDLNFEIVGVEPPPYASVPTLNFKLHVINATPQEPIHSVSLRCQIQLAVTRRRYSPEAQAQLLEVFGEPSRWGETLRSLLWTHTNVVLPQITDEVTVDMPVACTYDFEVTSAKYFHALGDGDIPLTFLFSGTIFYEGASGHLQVSQISWAKEASYRFPVSVWQKMMEIYYPNSAYIRLQRDIFNRLYQYKATHGLPTWDNVITRLLENSSEEVRS